LKAKEKNKDDSDNDDDKDEEENDNKSDNENDEEEDTLSIKINKKDLRILMTTSEKCDWKYQEGLHLCNEGSYKFSLDY